MALVVLLLNLFLAGRFAPPPDPERPGRLRSVASRLGEAQRQAEQAARLRRLRGRASGRRASSPAAGGVEFAGAFDADDIPDLVPIATLGHRGRRAC